MNKLFIAIFAIIMVSSVMTMKIRSGVNVEGISSISILFLLIYYMSNLRINLDAQQDVNDEINANKKCIDECVDVLSDPTSKAQLDGSGHWLQGSGHWLQGSGHWLQGSGHWLQGSGHWLQGSGHWLQAETGNIDITSFNLGWCASNCEDESS